MMNKRMNRFNRMFEADGMGAGKGRGQGNGIGKWNEEHNHEHEEGKGKGKRNGGRHGKCCGGKGHDHGDENSCVDDTSNGLDHVEEVKGEGKKYGKGHGRGKNNGKGCGDDHSHGKGDGTGPMENHDGTGPRAQTGVCDGNC